MNLKTVASSAALIAMMSVPVHAELEITNDVSYFDVKGTTPIEIYRSILDRSLKIDGKRTVASITTKLTQSGDVQESGNSCKVEDYKIRLNFVINRPQVANEKNLTPADKESWEQMYAFIKSHEELHRQIWLSCAEKLNSEVGTLAEASCDETVARTNSLWAQMIENCDQQQRSFDDVQTKSLLNQKFYIDAMRGQKAE